MLGESESPYPCHSGNVANSLSSTELPEEGSIHTLASVVPHECLSLRVSSAIAIGDPIYKFSPLSQKTYHQSGIPPFLSLTMQVHLQMCMVILHLADHSVKPQSN